MRDFGRFQTANAKLIQSIEVALTTATLPGALVISGQAGSGRRLLAEVIIDRLGSDRLKRWQGQSSITCQVGDVILVENVDSLSLAEQQTVARQIESERAVTKWIMTSSKQGAADLHPELALASEGFCLSVPSLSERKEDFIFLVNQFISVFALIIGRSTPKIAFSALEHLRRHNWPGNVAELERVIERAVQLCSSEIMPHHLIFQSQSQISYATQSKASLADMEKKLILQTLEVTRYNKTKAADMLGISIRTLRNKLQIYRQEEAAP